MVFLFLYNTHILSIVFKFMSVKINYNNNDLKKKSNNTVLFVDENFNIFPLKKYLSKTEYSFIYDLLKVNDRGVLIYKEFLDKEDLKKYKFSERESNSTLDQQSFIYKALSGIRTKIDDPLGKKRGSLGK